MRARWVPGFQEVRMYDYTDEHGRTLAIGTRVRCNDDFGVVEEISDPDGDVDDEGRSVGIPPNIFVRFDDGSLDVFRAFWSAKGWWDEDAPYVCDDVDVVD